MDPASGIAHPFCSRTCAKEYELRRAPLLRDRVHFWSCVSLSMSIGVYVFVHFSRQLYLLLRPPHHSRWVSVPSKCIHSLRLACFKFVGLPGTPGTSPSIQTLAAAGSSPPAFSLTTIPKPDPSFHQECTEKIFNLTQSLASTQQKLDECLVFNLMHLGGPVCSVRPSRLLIRRQIAPIWKTNLPGWRKIQSSCRNCVKESVSTR